MAQYNRHRPSYEPWNYFNSPFLHLCVVCKPTLVPPLSFYGHLTSFDHLASFDHSTSLWRLFSTCFDHSTSSLRRWTTFCLRRLERRDELGMRSQEQLNLDNSEKKIIVERHELDSWHLQWKPLNVIMVSVISCLLWSYFIGPIC